MARYMRGFTARFARLTKSGLLEFEAQEFAGAYPTFARYPSASDPSVYLHRMMRSRRQTVINLRRYDYSDEMIEDYILIQYARRGWLKPDGDPDPWKLLEFHRRQAIKDNEYHPMKKSHGIRAGSISKGDIKGQRARARARAKAKAGKDLTLDEYDVGRMR